MILNKKKCGILWNGQSKETKNDILYNGIPYVNNYKYLGINLNRDCNTSTHLEFLKKKLEKYKKLITILNL